MGAAAEAGAPAGPGAGCDAGLTLLELLAAVAVAMLLILALPALGGGESGHARAVRLVAGELAAARAEALRTARPVAVVFDPGARRLARHDGGDAAAFETLPGDAALAVEAPAGALPGEPLPAIVFLPDGSATGGSVTLTTGERRDRIAVRWLTGAIRLAELPPA